MEECIFLLCRYVDGGWVGKEGGREAKGKGRAAAKLGAEAKGRALVARPRVLRRRLTPQCLESILGRCRAIPWP